MLHKRIWLTALLLLAGALVLTACGGNGEATPCPEVECPDVECPEAPTCTEAPFEALWAGSGHADATSEAFRHWDEDDPMAVPARCAKCHSSYGYQDFVGADGTEAGVIDAEDFAVDSTVDCAACHSAAIMMLDSVVFPSGAEITGLGDDARCMQCHQGNASAVSVDSAIEDRGLGDDDVSTGEGALRFVNVHYAAAAATRYGTFAMGGYQYAGKTYDGLFAHVEEFDNCNECHNSHSLEVQVESCYCHDATTVEELRDERLEGSAEDYDGDGDMEEGIYYEIMGLQELLYAAMQGYSAGAGGTVVYNADAYPYFFDEAGESYAAWTPRLLRAAYNYQYALKDHGAYAHGGKYVIQLLYDSIEDLGGDVSGLHRGDAGHFDGSTEAYRHWDDDGEVRDSCARCHSADGLAFYLENGSNIATEIANGMQCTTCHDHEAFPALYPSDSVEFPSGASASFGEGVASNLCMNCHQGVESGSGVDEELAGLPLDVVSEDVGFTNVHYFAAGATLFGGEVNGAYQYAGQTYAGATAHPVNTCVDCHDPHELAPELDGCTGCHAGAASFEDIRMAATDFDGDGDTDEGVAGEIATMHEALYAAIQAYATNNAAAADIVYNSARYPYWFTADGERYATWTPRLARAAYNYQFVTKDPGGYTHNSTYIIQILYDTLSDLGAAGGMTRP